MPNPEDTLRDRVVAASADLRNKAYAAATRAEQIRAVEHGVGADA